MTYFAARTRPFDLLRLCRQWIADAGDDVVVGGLQRVRYTEGYPYLLALAVVLWLSSAPLSTSKLHHLILLVLFLPGCTPQANVDDDAAFRARFEQGSKLLTFAREQSDADPLAERSLLVDAREEFLLAALLQAGDIETARQIASITRRLRELETEIEKQRAEEERRQEKLAETIRRLEKLTGRQKRLAQRSRQVLRSPPVPSGEAANLPESMLSSGQLLPEEELDDLARPLAAAQRPVREETTGILDKITGQRDKLREILTRAYGNVEKLPPTEVDPVVDLLAETVAAQDEALANLVTGKVVLPRANTALHTAAGRMEQAFEALCSLLPPATDEQDDSMASRNAGDYDEELEGLDTGAQNKKSQPQPAGDFQEMLLLQALPIPNYTSAEIMAEEAANQQRRARRNAARAGAKVEKNW